MVKGEYDAGAEMEKMGGLTGMLSSKEGMGQGRKMLANIRDGLQTDIDSGKVEAGGGRFVINQEALQSVIQQLNTSTAEAKNKALEGAQKKNRELEGDGGVAGDTIIMNGAGDRGATATQQGPGGQTKITAQLAPTKMRRDASGKFVYGAAAGL